MDDAILGELAARAVIVVGNLQLFEHTQDGLPALRLSKVSPCCLAAEEQWNTETPVIRYLPYGHQPGTTLHDVIYTTLLPRVAALD